MDPSPSSYRPAGARIRGTGTGVPLSGTLTFGVRVIMDAPDATLTRVQEALANLPSVAGVDAALGPNRERMRLTTTSIASLLTELGQTPALAGAGITWTPVEGLVLHLPNQAYHAPPGAPAPAVHAPVLIVANGVVAPPEPVAVGGGDAHAPGRLRRVLGGLRPRRWAGSETLNLLILLAVLAFALTPRSPDPVTPSAESVSPTGDAATAPNLHVTSISRNMSSVCLMPPSRQPCDEVGEALWRGDLTTWQRLLRSLGSRPPTAEEVFAQSLDLRLSMGDPPTRVNFARDAGLDAVFLSTAQYVSRPEGADLLVELSNLGAAPADLGAARVEDEQGAVLLALPSDATLAAGARCWLSTRPPVSDACPFTAAVLGRVPDPAATLVLRNRAGDVIDTLDAAVTPR